MEFVADLHIHSYLSMACSPRLRPEPLYQACQLKGVTVLATGDFTHPRWFSELKDKMIPAEPGLYQLKPELSRAADRDVPASCRGPVRFLLDVEISCVYKKKGRTRRIHHLVYAPSFDVAARINRQLEKIGTLSSDGRPILRLDSKDLLSIVLEASVDAYLIPAHAWTPHFGVFGSASGFDALEECFEDLTPRIFAIETGLSSDPPMNWRLSSLDRLALVSNSDAHSPEALAREANLFDTELSYRGLFDAIRERDPARFLRTFEFFPQQGKYHADGHRTCRIGLLPEQTRRCKGQCPTCHKSLTIGVLHRVENLADRRQGRPPSGAAGYENLMSLRDIIAETLHVRPQSVQVERQYHQLLSHFGNELRVLRKLDLESLEAAGFPGLALAIGRMRRGDVRVRPGYDVVYGKVSLLNQGAIRKES